MGRLIHRMFNAATYLFLGALILTIAVVVLVIVVPTLQGRDILDGSLYDMIEALLIRMLPYIIFFALGYVVSSWGRYLSEPRQPRPNERSPDQARDAPGHPPSREDGRGGASATHAYRPEVVPPTHP